MPKSFPSYASLLLRCDHRSFPICVLYLWHELQHPEKVHWRTKRPLHTCFKRKKKNNPKTWLLISNALWERSSFKGGMWKLIKGNISKLESGVQKGELSQTYHSHTYRFQQKKTCLVSLVGSDPTIASRRKRKFPLAWQHQSMRDCHSSANTKNQPIQKITMLWTPSFL